MDDAAEQDYVLHVEACKGECHGGFVCPVCHEAFGWCTNADPITDPEKHPPECMHSDIARYKKVYQS